MVLAITRNTFQAGRVSPNGLTTAWKLWTRPSALTKVPGVSVKGVNLFVLVVDYAHLEKRDHIVCEHFSVNTQVVLMG